MKKYLMFCFFMLVCIATTFVTVNIYTESTENKNTLNIENNLQKIVSYETSNFDCPVLNLANSNDDLEEVIVKPHYTTAIFGDEESEIDFDVLSPKISKNDFFGGLSRDDIENKNVGVYKINSGDLRLIGNYKITVQDGNYEILKKKIKVRLFANSPLYGEKVKINHTFMDENNNVIRDVDFDHFDFEVDDFGTDAGTYENIGVKSYNEPNYDLIEVIDTYVCIRRRFIKVTAQDIDKVYGDDSLELDFIFNNANYIEKSNFTGELEIKNLGKNVGEYKISQGTLKLSKNYNLLFSSGKLNIKPKTIVVTPADIECEYGENKKLTYSYNENDLIDGDKFTGNISREMGFNVGSYKIKQNSLALNDNYNIVFKDAYYTINPTEIDVVANSMTVEKGKEYALSFEIVKGELKYGDNFKGKLMLAYIDESHSDIVQGTLFVNTNYIINFTKGKLTLIDKKDCDFVKFNNFDSVINGNIINVYFNKIQENLDITCQVSESATYNIYKNSECDDLQSPIMNVNFGVSTIYIKVVAENKTDFKIYQVNFNNTNPKDLEVELTSNYLQNNDSINLRVDYDTKIYNLDIKPYNTAVVNVYNDLDCNKKIDNINLAVGKNIYYLKVVSDIGTYKVYTLNIERSKDYTILKQVIPALIILVLIIGLEVIKFFIKKKRR